MNVSDWPIYVTVQIDIGRIDIDHNGDITRAIRRLRESNRIAELYLIREVYIRPDIVE